jgi:hypothetical protein
LPCKEYFRREDKSDIRKSEIGSQKAAGALSIGGFVYCVMKQMGNYPSGHTATVVRASRSWHHTKHEITTYPPAIAGGTDLNSFGGVFHCVFSVPIGDFTHTTDEHRIH